MSGPRKRHAYAAPAWAAEQRVGPGPKAVLLVLANYADENFSCFPGQETIAYETELHVNTVARHLKALEKHGLFIREKRYNREGRRTSDRYHLQLDVSVDIYANANAGTGQSLPTTVVDSDLSTTVVGRQVSDIPPGGDYPPPAPVTTHHEAADYPPPGGGRTPSSRTPSSRTPSCRATHASISDGKPHGNVLHMPHRTAAEVTMTANALLEEHRGQITPSLPRDVARRIGEQIDRLLDDPAVAVDEVREGLARLRANCRWGPGMLPNLVHEIRQERAGASGSLNLGGRGRPTNLHVDGNLPQINWIGGGS